MWWQSVLLCAVCVCLCVCVCHTVCVCLWLCVLVWSCVYLSVSVCVVTPNTLTHIRRVLVQCLPSTASQSLSSPPSSKSISHFVSASFSPSLFQKCSLNHFILLFLFFLHLPSLHFCPPTPSPVLFTPQALSNQSSHYSILFILFILFPPQRLIKSALCYDSHIFIQACPSKAQAGTILLQIAICSLKGTCHFRTRDTIPGKIILLIGKLLFFIWITQPPTLQRQQSNSVLKSNQSARRNIFTHPNHHILHLRALHEKHSLLRAVHMHPWVRQLRFTWSQYNDCVMKGRPPKSTS